MASISFVGDMKRIRALGILAREKGLHVGELVAEAIDTAYKSDIERIIASPFFGQGAPQMAQKNHKGRNTKEADAPNGHR